MAKGTRVQVTSRPRGVTETVKISGTPKPGTCMEIVPSTEPIEGVFTYAAYGTQAASSGQYVTNDGDRKAIAILLENNTENKTMDDAYVAGDFAEVYYPAMGEQFNMILEDVSGTGDTFVIGEELMVDNGTGKLLTADSDAEAHPFTLLETVSTAPTADHIRHVRFNGEGGA
jgi:hypothetical protein